MNQFALIFGAYVLGSVPFGLWLGLWLKGVDIRQHGSGNIGASNAYRVLGWPVGIPVWILDVAKGLIPVLIARRYYPPFVMPTCSAPLCSFDIIIPVLRFEGLMIVATGLAAIIGHNSSIFLKFKGGKGVATSLGVAVGMSWEAGLAAFVVWCIVLLITRYISVASLCSVPVGSVGIWLLNGRSIPYGVFGVAATVFSFVKHRSNMGRLKAGTEPKVFEKKPETQE